MAKFTMEQIKQKGSLMAGDEIVSSRSLLAKTLFNAEADDNEASFFIHKKIEGKDVKLRGWAVIFESKKIKKFNHLLEDGKNIRETLKDRFDMKKGELRAVFRSKGKDSWEFLGVFKFTGEDKPNDFEKLDMPKDCFTNCYERVSDELKLEDWQNEK